MNPIAKVVVWTVVVANKIYDVERFNDPANKLLIFIKVPGVTPVVGIVSTPLPVPVNNTYKLLNDGIGSV